MEFVAEPMGTPAALLQKCRRYSFSSGLPPTVLSAQLSGRDTNGFQQSVKSNITGNRDLKYIVNNQITGENNKGKKSSDGNDISFAGSPCQ